MATQTPKQKIVQTVKDLPDNATIEQAIAELVRLTETPANQSVAWEDLPEAAKEGIEAGLSDVKNGRIISNKDFWAQYADRV